jgi:hypothetical protein
LIYIFAEQKYLALKTSVFARTILCFHTLRLRANLITLDSSAAKYMRAERKVSGAPNFQVIVFVQFYGGRVLLTQMASLSQGENSPLGITCFIHIHSTI